MNNISQIYFDDIFELIIAIFLIDNSKMLICFKLYKISRIPFKSLETIIFLHKIKKKYFINIIKGTTYNKYLLPLINILSKQKLIDRMPKLYFKLYLRFLCSIHILFYYLASFL